MKAEIAEVLLFGVEGSSILATTLISPDTATIFSCRFKFLYQFPSFHGPADASSPSVVESFDADKHAGKRSESTTRMNELQGEIDLTG